MALSVSKISWYILFLTAQILGDVGISLTSKRLYFWLYIGLAFDFFSKSSL